MFALRNARWERWLLVACAVGLLVYIGLGSTPGKAAQSTARAAWQFRVVETPAISIQATVEGLGRDGWEVFNVYGAASLNNEGGALKMVPHTFYVFAKKPM